MKTAVQSTGTEILPQQFVTSMRTLFDIMDDKRSGLVDITDIELRWDDDGTKGLPKGVVESLRKVTAPNGMLTFDRFCAGLKICLLRNHVEPNANNTDASNLRPPSAPLLDIDPPEKSQWSNTVTIRPNNGLPQQRTLSMPQLVSNPNELLTTSKTSHSTNSTKTLLGPPKPPRIAAGLDYNTTFGSNTDHMVIRTVSNKSRKIGPPTNAHDYSNEQRNLIAANEFHVDRGLADGSAIISNELQSNISQKRSLICRRKEPRRHTLQHGIDYNMLKRIKQIEQEKDILLQGLTAVDKTKEWYIKQIHSCQERMKYLGRLGHVEPWSEAQQERLELKRARVFEVNKQLTLLIESWERGGLPFHMNLAIQHFSHVPNTYLDRLKDQNRHLLEENEKKTNRIIILERDKADLLQVLKTRTMANKNISREEKIFD